MNLIESFKHCVFQNYANFNGRTSVGVYWKFFLVNIILSVVASVVDNVIGMTVLAGIVSLGLLLPGLGAGIRRLHDSGTSGWYLLISLIPLAGAILLILKLVKAGDPGQNAYGPPPVEGQQPALA